MKQYVKITKLGAVSDPKVRSLQWEEWYAGIRDGSLPVDYTLEGYLMDEIKVGSSILVERKVRNNIKKDGLFKSTEVLTFDGKIATTLNSKYLIEKINYV